MKLTLLLIFLNIGIFIFSLTNFDYILTNYGFSINNLYAGNYHTMLTSIFLHAGVMHLAYNMLALFLLGWTVEQNVKEWQYLLIYLIAGVVGNLAFFIPIFGYTANMIAVGASAAISGLVGLGTFMFPGKMVIFPAAIPIPFVLAGALYFLINLTSLFSPSNIAYSAHLIGLGIGSIFGLAWGEKKRQHILIFILLAFLIVSASFVLSYLLT